MMGAYLLGGQRPKMETRIMMRNMTLKAIVPTLLGCLIAAGAQAQSTSVPQEITSYRNLVVKMAGTPSKCNLTDTALLQTQLAGKLAAIGITQRDQSYAGVELLVTTQKFAGVTPHCATLVELAFVGAIGKDNFVTSDEALKSAIDRMKVVPVIFYKEGRMAVQPQIEGSAGQESKDTEKAVLTMIDTLVDSLKAKRE